MKLNQEWLLIIGLVILAFAFRWWLIADNKIYFWYDQARDAYSSQSILENKDLKIQGPSASGTNDTVYHGVAYYYLLAPLYAVANGNPYLVALMIAALNSLAVIPYFLLVKKVSQSSLLAALSCGLLAINFEHAQYSTWLSNPTMALIPIVLFFLATWQLFYIQLKTVNRIGWLVLLGLALGLLQQSAFYSLYFWGVLVIAWIYRASRNAKPERLPLSLKECLVFVATYLLTIATMILTQIKLMAAGIFTLSSLTQSFGREHTVVDFKHLTQFAVMYVTKFVETLSPQFTILALVLMFLMVIVFWRKSDLAGKMFWTSWITAPLWLFVVHFRDSHHILVGLEYVIIFLLSLALAQLLKARLVIVKTLAIALIALYTLAQVSTLLLYREKNMSLFTFQEGVLLQRQLEIIDYTYQTAAGNPFSISLWVSPYEYYISWAYLFDWYGKSKYGYVPSYFGTSQAGKVGDTLLPQLDSLGATHFVIQEPGIMIGGNFYQNFLQRQEDVSTIVRDEQTDEAGFKKFGEYLVQTRLPKKIEEN